MLTTQQHNLIERQASRCPCCGRPAALAPRRPPCCLGLAGQVPRLRVHVPDLSLVCEPCGYSEDFELLLDRLVTAYWDGTWAGPGDAA